MKKIFSLLLALIVFLATPTMAFASLSANDNVGLNSEQLSIGQELISTWYQSEIQGSGPLYIGKAIPTYSYKNGSTNDFFQNHYYPIFNNNKVIGIFTVMNANTPQETYIVGDDWADDLQTFYETSAPFCLIVIDSSVFLKSTNKIILVEEAKFINSNQQNNARSINNIDMTNLKSANLSIRQPVRIIQSPNWPKKSVGCRISTAIL